MAGLWRGYGAGRELHGKKRPRDAGAAHSNGIAAAASYDEASRPPPLCPAPWDVAAARFTNSRTTGKRNNRLS
jgi:hypothetical protein